VFQKERLKLVSQYHLCRNLEEKVVRGSGEIGYSIRRLAIQLTQRRGIRFRRSLCVPRG
jgi:hypothetical protein